MPSNHLILCHPLLLLSSVFPSIRVFSNESVLCIMWPKYWSLSFSVSPSNEYSGLIFFRINWFDFLVVQETLKSLLQNHNSEHQFFGAQYFYGPILTPTHDYWKNHSFDYMDHQFVGKVMSLLLTTLSRFVSFSSKEQACFNFMVVVTVCSSFGAQEQKFLSLFPFLPIYLPWGDGTRCRDLSFFSVEF